MAVCHHRIVTSRAQVSSASGSLVDAEPDRSGLPHPQPTPIEWAVVVLALFVLGRSPVLFLRQRLMDEIGGPVGPLWQDDGLIRWTLLTPAVVVCAFAVRRTELRRVVRHLLLVALVSLALASTAWSVEPAVTLVRAVMFLTTAGVGWHLGARFSLRQQLDAVIGAGAVGIAASLGALVRWPVLARSTNGVLGEWSGVYVNRNLLALAVCTTLLAVLLRWPSASARHRLALVVLTVSAVWLLRHSNARTGPVSLAAALSAASLAGIVRISVVKRGMGRVTATAAMLLGAVGGLWLAARATGAILELLDREPTLTRRTEMWDIDRMLVAQRPWRGWGFEAIWSHQPAIDFAAPRFQAYPYQAHNGYFEMALSLGRVGLVLLLALIVLTLVRCVALAWEQPGVEALWPLAMATYAVVANLSESLFVANEAQWALFVASGVAAMTARSVAGVDQARAGRRSIS